MRRRAGTSIFFSEHNLWIKDEAIGVHKLGEMEVFVRPPAGVHPGRLAKKESFYRVWAGKSGNLMEIGRLYADGKYCSLSTRWAELATGSRGWKPALATMRNAVLAHKVMTE